MNRIAPEGGYGFPQKTHYRRQIWRQFREHRKTCRATSQALLMPTIEGTEIEVALANGFRQENLHVVDDNPAIVAHLKRRFGKINTYGLDLLEACARMAKRGVRLDVANLDLCSNVNAASMYYLKRIRQTGVFSEGALVAVTVLRGREKDVKEWESRWGDAVPNGGRQGFIDNTRRSFVGFGIHGAWCRDTTGIYKSTAAHQTMLWSIYLLFPLSWDWVDTMKLVYGGQAS